MSAQRVHLIAATRFDGGDIRVALALDGDVAMHWMVTTDAPTLTIELFGISIVDRVIGPITGAPCAEPRTFTVQKGSVGNAFKF